MLLETYQDLQEQKIAIPDELKRALQLLHSYVITKRLVSLKDHFGAAKMLLRVAKNISKFPARMTIMLLSNHYIFQLFLMTE